MKALSRKTNFYNILKIGLLSPNDKTVPNIAENPITEHSKISEDESK